MAIRFHSDEIPFRLEQRRRHQQWIRQSIQGESRIPGEINFIFTSNERLMVMNRQYLNHNHFTDVITFDYSEDQVVSGDIFISMDQVWENADHYRCHREEELRRVMIHGVLHLMGYQDKKPEETAIMREKEKDALNLWLKTV